MIRPSISGELTIINQTSYRTTIRRAGLRVAQPLLVLAGLVLSGLSVLLPILMRKAMAPHGVVSGYMLGYVVSLSPFITYAAMASSFIIAVVIMSFGRSQFTTSSLAFAAVTASVLVVEMCISLYLPAIEPARSAPSSILWLYALIGLTPFGLACMMFTLASMLTS
ncbi:MAG TPA: hypothetical protein VLV18_08790 [Terriglobales bacterium]|nr:hypothetical protein [Terriglobales bacterium]